MSWPHHIGETHQPDWVVYVRDRNLREITFRLTNVIPERMVFVSRGITVSSLGPLPWSWDGSVGIVSSYGLNDQGYDFGKRQALKLPDRLRESHTLPLNGYRWGGVMLTIYLHPVPRFSMSGAMPLLPLCLHVAQRYNFCSLLRSSLLWNIFQTCYKCDFIKPIHYMYSFWYEFTRENRDRTIFSSHRAKSTRTKIKLVQYHSAQTPQKTQHKAQIYMNGWQFLVCSKSNAEQ
jgi:hypothetical protein